MLGHVLAIRGAGQWRDPRQRCGGTNTCRFATWALELGCGARQHGPHSHAATFSHTLRHQHSAMMPAGAAASTTSGANAMWRTRANSWHMICFRGEVACVGLPELFPAHAKKLFLACPGAAWALFRAVMGVLATGLEHGTLWRLACGCWRLLTHAPRGCAHQTSGLGIINFFLGTLHSWVMDVVSATYGPHGRLTIAPYVTSCVRISEPLNAPAIVVLTERAVWQDNRGRLGERPNRRCVRYGLHRDAEGVPSSRVREAGDSQSSCEGCYIQWSRLQHSFECRQ